ncbi:lysine--tRNA ligase, chloroplastic/mitochondrial-like [Humulus lupulus]|uniref:lysine--tRNA ligase, chloroplastic/mitochondrial-like n=1 Tax=Humulus lupulus TaxID=3486 RepID=UPI002B41363E|nr:lysine--tRNA ligase, chloroplastic/mitochondrial-like [Humulus lupulus]
MSIPYVLSPLTQVDGNKENLETANPIKTIMKPHCNGRVSHNLILYALDGSLAQSHETENGVHHLFKTLSSSTTAFRARRSSSSFSSSPLLIRSCSSTATATNPNAHNRRSSSSSSSTTSSPDSVRVIRLQKIEELRSKGLEPYAYKWDRTHSANQLQETYKNLENGKEMNGEQDNVSIARRIVARRAFGKLAFLTLRDDSGTIQIYCEKARFLSDQFDELKNLVDIGDILGASGSIKRTQKGELSVYVNSFAILTKSLLPLPGKYHGLTHVDKHYRQRYIDMISNPEVADVFWKRAKIVSELCKTVESFGFLEVETRVLQVCGFSNRFMVIWFISRFSISIMEFDFIVWLSSYGAAGGAEARPFVTYHNSLGRDLYLRIATELHLKRMLVVVPGGRGKPSKIVDKDEGLEKFDAAKLTKIRPSFKQNEGSVTPGNASIIRFPPLSFPPPPMLKKKLLT